jgi:hypothetical protein
MSEPSDKNAKPELFDMTGVTIDISRAELVKLNQRVIDSVRRMTPQEAMESLIQSGIYTPTGDLAKEYGG